MAFGPRWLFLSPPPPPYEEVLLHLKLWGGSTLLPSRCHQHEEEPSPASSSSPPFITLHSRGNALPCLPYAPCQWGPTWTGRLQSSCTGLILPLSSAHVLSW